MKAWDALGPGLHDDEFLGEGSFDRQAGGCDGDGAGGARGCVGGDQG